MKMRLKIRPGSTLDRSWRVINRRGGNYHHVHFHMEGNEYWTEEGAFDLEPFLNDTNIVVVVAGVESVPGFDPLTMEEFGQEDDDGETGDGAGHEAKPKRTRAKKA